MKSEVYTQQNTDKQITNKIHNTRARPKASLLYLYSCILSIFCKRSGLCSVVYSIAVYHLYFLISNT
jgi:hypothetical protein